MSHIGNPDNVLRIVRRYLHATPRGRLLPGPPSYIGGFRKFKEDLPGIAAAAEWGDEEIDPFQQYRVYLELLDEFVRNPKVPA